MCAITSLFLCLSLQLQIYVLYIHRKFSICFGMVCNEIFLTLVWKFGHNHDDDDDDDVSSCPSLACAARRAPTTGDSRLILCCLSLFLSCLLSLGVWGSPVRPHAPSSKPNARFRCPRPKSRNTSTTRR